MRRRWSYVATEAKCRNGIIMAIAIQSTCMPLTSCIPGERTVPSGDRVYRRSDAQHLDAFKHRVGFRVVSIGHPGFESEKSKTITIGQLLTHQSGLPLSIMTTVASMNAYKNLSEIATETLSVKNRNRTFTKKLRLTLGSPLLEVSRKDVSVEVVVDSSIEKIFTDIPLRLVFTPDQRVSSDEVALDTLVVQGARSRIDELRWQDITVQIRLTKLSPGEYDLPATILLPDYITPVYSEPQRFNIVIY